MFCGLCLEQFTTTLPECCPKCKSVIFANEIPEYESIPYEIQLAIPQRGSLQHQGVSKVIVEDTNTPPDNGTQTRIPLKDLLYHYRYISGDWNAFYAEEFDWLDDTTHQSPYWAETEAKPGREPEGLKERVISLFNKWDPKELDQVPTPMFIVSIRGRGFTREIALAANISKVKSIAKDCMEDTKGWLEGVLNQRIIPTRTKSGKVINKSDLEHHYPKLYDTWYGGGK